jgi:integrase
LSQLERTQLLVQFGADPRAQRRDLPDLVFFMLATGVRIGEALGVMGSEVDLDAGTVEISSTMKDGGDHPR